MVAPASARDWRFESRLPWPGVRGHRLWQLVTSTGAGSAQSDNASDDEDEPRRPSPPPPSVRYDVEMCESSAGHIALVLLRRDSSGSSTGGETNSSGPTGRHASTPPATNAATAAAAAQLAIPRVLYVVDAVPPKRATPVAPSSSYPSFPVKRGALAEPRWTMLSSDARAHSFGGAPTSAASASEGVATPSLVFSAVQAHSHHVDELELIEELFTTARATKDACILAKPPLLCARFDCRLVAVQFVRHGGRPTGAHDAPPLRCIVAREDGMCYIWEWSADLHTWSFLNRFCFLDNPNLKWTRPVLLFASTACLAWDAQVSAGAGAIDSGSGGGIGSGSGALETTELTWWSAEAKTEPKLFVRKIQFGVEKSTFRTEIRIGSAFEVSPPVSGVAALHSSSLGLWVVSRALGVRLRSVATLRVLSLAWSALLGDGVVDTDDEAVALPLTCVHSVTGELLALDRRSGRVSVVTTKKASDGQPTLVAKQLLTIARASTPTKENHDDDDHDDDDDESVLGLAVHRQLVLTLLGRRVDVHSVVSGEKLASLVLPKAAWSVETPLTLWSAAAGAGASAVGLFSARGYWQLHSPSGRALAATHRVQTSAAHGLRVARPYGETLAFDAAQFALELLQSARALVGPTHAAVWQVAVRSLSSPALLLATLAPSASPLATQRLLDDMAELVAAIYRVTHEVLVTGRFGAAVDKRDDALLLRGLPLVTPANVEALHHLANWVLLAKRKLARLQSAVVHKGPHHLRARTVSSLSTFNEDGDELATAAPMPSLQPLHPLHDALDDDASASQLSRKLRPMTSLQFAAGSCSARHGGQWLAQLETLLLPPAPAPPHALLFHEERALVDFAAVLSSFSKHFYFESMCRLYLLHAPAQLLPFVARVEQFAPRLFRLSGARAVARSHAERALLLFPPARRLVARARLETQQQMQQQQLKTEVTAEAATAPRSAHERTTSDRKSAEPSATARLLAYAELLCRCGSTLEACRVLLDADLYEHCVDTLLAGGSSDDACAAVFFAALDYCVARRGAGDLDALLSRKPRHVDALLVLRALKQLLPLQPVRADDATAARVVSVGSLRPVLLRLLREHRADRQLIN